MDKMDEKRVPAAGRLLYADTYTKTLIDTAKEAARNLSAQDTTVARSLDRIGEVEVIGVPTTAMKSAYNFTDDGFEVATDKYELTADTEVVSGKTYYTKSGTSYTAVESPAKSGLNTYYEKVQAPSSLSQGKWTYFEESFEDVFIFNKKHDAIQFYVERKA